MSLDVDVVVVGGGAAGLAAAYAARRRDASVVLVERHRLGGECTWTGCVPSKTLLEASRRQHGARRLGLDGAADFASVMAHVRDVVAQVSREEDRAALERLGIRVVEGEATFVGQRRLSAGGTTVSGRVVVLATGSSPAVPAVLAVAHPLTNATVFGLRRLPRRLVVVGGGPVGCELGQAFARLGSRVTVLQRADRLVRKEEPEAGQVLRHVLTQDGVEVRFSARVTGARRDLDGSVVVEVDGQALAADELLVATGRQAVTDGLAPERGGLALDERGWIRVDESLATTAEGVYAVGDVTGGPQYTHAGYDMGTLAVANGLGRRRRAFDTTALPWATFTAPEIGRVGLTEAQAHRRFGERAQVAYLPIAETDRAKCSGDNDGFVKLVAAPRRLVRRLGGGRLVGATVVCPTGADVVHELALAVRTRAFAGRLAQTVHVYPSWSLAVREAAALFFADYKGHRARPARAA